MNPESFIKKKKIYSIINIMTANIFDYDGKNTFNPQTKEKESF